MMQLGSTLTIPTDIGKIIVNSISTANGYCCAPEMLSLMGVVNDNYQDMLGSL